MSRQRMRAGAAAAALLVCVAPALAEDRRVPEEFFSLESAAAAAAPGDRIVLRGEVRVRENRHEDDTIPIPDGVTIVGGRVRGEVEFSGDDLTFRRVEFRRWVQVAGDRVAFVRCRFSNAVLGVVGAETVLRDCRSSSLIVRITGDDAEVRDNRGQFRLTVTGDSADVAHNVFVRSGVGVVGDDAQVQNNRTRGIRGAVWINGERASVLDNRIGPSQRQSVGVSVTGGDVVVSGNRVVRAKDGIIVVPSRYPSGPASVTDNRVILRTRVSTSSYGYAAVTVVADSPGSIVSGNRIVCASRAGILVEGREATVNDNDITAYEGATGLDTVGTGIRVVGPGVAIERNVIRQERGAFEDQHGHGIEIKGDDAWAIDNFVRGSRAHGLVMDGSGLAERNEIRHPSGHGIAVVHAGVTLQDNVVIGPGQDGLYLRATDAHVDKLEITGAGGVGAHVHADSAEALLEGVSITECRSGGMFVAAQGVRVLGANLRMNRKADLIWLENIAVFGGAPGIETNDASLAPRGRDEWFEARHGYSHPVSGRSITFRPAGFVDINDYDSLFLRSDRVVVRRGRAYSLGDENVVARISTDDFQAIWDFVASSGLDAATVSRTSLGAVEFVNPRGHQRSADKDSHPAADTLFEMLVEALENAVSRDSP